jgi:hypothetical protein
MRRPRVTHPADAGRRRASTRKAAALRSLAGFSALHDRDLARLATLFDEVRVAPATVLARAGQTTHELIVIVDGAATATDEHGAARHLGPGRCVGDLAVLGHGDAVTVVTDTDAQLLVAGPRTIRAALDHPTVLRHVAVNLAEQLLTRPATDDRLVG